MSTDYPALARQALAALRQGEAKAALNLFEQVTKTGRGDGSVFVGKAYAHQALGDQAGLLEAVDQALSREPNNTRALLLKGDYFQDQGDTRSAATFYAAALKNAPARISPDLAAAFGRAQAAIEALSGGFDDYLVEAFAKRGLPAPTEGSARFAQSLDLMAGRATVYLQQPRFYYFPGLPQVQFAPREATPWLDQVEAASNTIRAELEAVLDQPELFAPYVEMQENRPNSDQAGMLENPDWSALYLYKDGQPVPEMANAFAKTLAVVEGLPLTDIDGRAPSVLFSRLEPGAHIPPHHGLINTRLICHLPLIVPPDCQLRVGSETRNWTYGQAFAFDDTIEHEAWNRSDQTRIVMIFDVWKPEITQTERQMIRGLFAAIDDYGGGPQSLDV